MGIVAVLTSACACAVPELITAAAISHGLATIMTLYLDIYIYISIYLYIYISIYLYLYIT